MKKLIPTSKFRGRKDNSDSLKARLRDQRGGKSNLPLLNRAENAWLALDDLRKKRERNINYIWHDQWSDWVRDEKGRLVRESERVAKRTGGVALQNNHLVKIIHTLSGLYAKQNTEPICFARRPDCDEQSEMMTDALQTSWQANQMQDMLVSWIEEFLAGGMAVDIEEWACINGVEDVYSFAVEPSHFFFESQGVDPRHWDIELIGHFEDYSLGKLAAKYAKSRYDYKQLEYIYEPYMHSNKYLGPSSQQTDKLKNPYWNVTEQDMCRVYHVWTKEHKQRYRCKDIMDYAQPLYRIEPEDLPKVIEENNARIAQGFAEGIPEEDIPLIEYKEIFDTYWHYQAIAPNGLVLEEYDNPNEHKDHPYVFKCYEYINGDIIPFISSVIDQQRYINRLITLFDLVIQASAKGVTMIPKSCVPKNMSEKEFARSIREIGGFLFYDDKNGKNPNKPEIIVSNTNMTGITDMLQLQLGFIPEITSVSDSLQGKSPGANVAASRYAMETQNSTTSISALRLKFQTFETEVAKKKMKMIHQYYGDEKNISNSRSGGYAQFYHYNPKMVQDLDFDVRVMMSPDSPVFRMAIGDTVKEMWQAGAIDAATMLQFSGLPGSSPIVKHLMQVQQAMAEQAGQQQQQALPLPASNAPSTAGTGVNPAAMQTGHPYVRGENIDSQTAV